jgi:hypothetical protein
MVDDCSNFVEASTMRTDVPTESCSGVWWYRSMPAVFRSEGIGRPWMRMGKQSKSCVLHCIYFMLDMTLLSIV